MKPTDIYRTYLPETKEYYLFAAQETFTKIDQIHRYKTSLNSYKKIKITFYISSIHHTLRVDTNNGNNRNLTNSTEQCNNE